MAKKLGQAVDVSYHTGAKKLGSPSVSASNAYDMSKQYFYGFNEALYNMSGWSYIDQSASMIGLTEEGTIGNWVKRNVFRVGDTKPKTKAERIARSSGEGTAFGALSAMGTGIVAQLSTKAPLAAKTSEKVVSSIMEAFRTNPTSFMLWETITSGTSEAGRKTAEEAGGGGVAQTAGAVAGALAPPGVAMSLYGAGKYGPTAWLINKLRGKPQPWSEVMEKSAARQVSGALETGIGDSDELMRSRQVFDRLGVQESPSIAEASGSPQLLAKQREIEANAIGSELDKLVQRKVRAGQQVRQAGVDQGPQAREIDVDNLSIAVRDRFEDAVHRFDNELDDIETVRSITGTRIPEANRSNLGETLRARRNALRLEASQEFSRRADDIGLNSSEGGLDASSFVDDITERFFNKQNKFANKERPGILKTIKSLRSKDDEVVDESIQFTFEDVKALRKRLNDDISTALNNDRSKARELIETKKMLDDWFESVEPPPSVDAEAWAQFRQDYVQDFIQRFEQGTSFNIGRRTPRGDYKTRDEAVADAFLKNEGTVGDYYRVYSDADGNLDPEAAQSMSAALIDKANQYAVTDGMVNERKLTTWLNNNKKVLDFFPDIKARLTNTKDAVSDMAKRAAVLKQRQRAVERTKLRILAGRSRDPDEMFSAALSDPMTMRALIRSSEKAGLGRRPVKAAIWEKALDTVPEVGLPGPAGIRKFLDTHKSELRILYNDSPGHLRKLEDIYTGLEILNRTPLPKGDAQASGSVGQVEQYVGTGVAQASSRVFAVQSGRTGKFYPIIDGIVRFADRMTKRKADALIRQALFDPNVANTVHAAMISERIPKPIQRKLNAYLFQMGLEPVEQRFEEE